MGRTGSADLPLHGGRVPAWLHTRMASLGRLICEAIVLDYGRDELLSRLSHPFWFQAFGSVMGMDWHSSGITTSVVGALKKGLRPIEQELGIFVCGGRGKHSRKTPDELLAVGRRTDLDGEKLAHTSRLVAKVDSAAVQDGYALYLHAFIVAADGKWTVVQQGMNGERRLARRYHWLSEGLRSFVDEPHRAIEGSAHDPFVNLTDLRARPNRNAQVELVASPQGAAQAVEVLKTLREAPHLKLPAHHEVKASDVFLRRLQSTLQSAAERGPVDFQQLLMTPGLGARTLFSLALVSEVVHGAPCRFEDPARFSLAHGGKDGHPFPVPLKVYDRTIHSLKQAVGRAKLGEKDRLHAIRKLDLQAREIERQAESGLSNLDGPSFERFVAGERRRSHAYGGMTVFGPAKKPKRVNASPPDPQLSLFGPETGK